MGLKMEKKTKNNLVKMLKKGERKPRKRIWWNI